MAHVHALIASAPDAGSGLDQAAVQRLGHVGSAQVLLVLAEHDADLAHPRVAVDALLALLRVAVRRFLQAAEGDRLAVLFRVAVLHGLRRGELIGLRWENLDLDASTLSVRQQLSWSGGEPTFVDPKTKKSRRMLRLDAGTVAALKQHRKDQLQEQLRAGAAWEGKKWGLAFAEEDGTPLRPYTPLFALKRLARKARVPELTLHELRHTAATLMLSEGVPPKVASVRLGHATVALTLDLYGHVLPQDDQDAADAVGNIVAGS